MPDKSQPLENIGDEHKLLGLDHLRAIAISYVLLFHYQFFGHPAWVNKISSFGWTGVDLFFVLSGFLISGQLFAQIAKGKVISLWEFFTKRFFRIIPPYLFVVLLYFTVPAAREWGHLSPAWQYLTFTLNLNLDPRQYGTFSHAWSLCVEEQFYLILPLVFLLFSHFKAGRKAAYLVAALFIGGFALRYWGWNHFIGLDPEPQWNRYIYYPTWNRLDPLLTGVSIAGLYAFYPNVKAMINKYSHSFLLFGLILLVASGFICKGYSTYNTTMWGFPLIAISYGLILAAVVSPSCFVYRFKSFITSQLAALSYSIYLSHKMVIHVTQNLFSNMGVGKDSNLMMVICAVTIVMMALAMRYIIEKPSLKLRNSILQKWKRKINPSFYQE